MPHSESAKQSKGPGRAGWLIGYAGVWLAAAGLVYFWRVVFFLPPQFPAALATLCAGGVLTVVYGAVFFLRRLPQERFALKAAALLFICGLLFCFAAAPLQAPDEEKHFLRANALSRGRFVYAYTERFPDDVSHLAEQFKAPMNHNVAHQGAQLAPARLEGYLNAVQSGRPPEEAASSPVMFLWLPFLHQGLFMAAARLLGLGALGQMYAGRIANLLLYAVIGYFTLQNCKRHRPVMTAFLFLPISLFMAASCSYDGLMLALCYYAAGFLLRDEITDRSLVLFVAAVAVANYIKPLNFLLAFLLLFIPKHRFSLRWRPWQKKGASVLLAAGAAMLFWFLLQYLDQAVLKQGWPALARGSGEGASPARQLSFVLAHPLRFAAVVLQSVAEADGFLFDLGRLGAMDTVVPLVSGLSVLALAGGAVWGVGAKPGVRTGTLAGMTAVALVYAAAVLGGMYVADSDFASIRITGPQPRYFLPVFLLLFSAGSMWLSRFLQPRAPCGGRAGRADAAALRAGLLLAVFCAVLLFQGAGIGQWLPKAEGGWKLVNLYGWVQT